MNRGSTSPRSTPPGAGGQHNEIGSEYRARVGALLATAVLLGDDLRQLGAPFGGTPTTIRAEADSPVDDLVLRLDDGRSVSLQAKHRASLSEMVSSPLGKATRQFVEAHRTEPSSDPLVLVYAHGSHPLTALGDWCASLRHAEPGVPSPAQVASGERFMALLRTLGVHDADEAKDLARRIYLWQAEPRHGDLYAVAMRRLAEIGVAADDRAPAFDLLTERVRLLARHRAGDGLEQLVDVLQHGRRLDLGGAQTPSVRAALLVAEYRERTVRRGRLLSAFGVPAAVANVPLSEGDAEVRVQLPRRPDENVATETSLAQALRRRGRVVVTGRGGSGKSTALRVLAAQLAAIPDGPIPLAAQWNDLDHRPDDPLGVLVTRATRDLVPADAELLTGALRAAFARGECALLLDGLDEVVAGRDRLAAIVKRWLDDAPPSTEVVVAARPSAAQAIGAFEWPELQLAEPRHPETTTRAVISAVARHDGRSAAWVDERVAWATERRNRDRDLAATPLMVVLLATLAATVERLQDLPSTRTAVLMTALGDIVTRWEVGTRHGDRVAVGDLAPSQAQEALFRALYVLSRATIMGEVDPGSALEEDLASFLGPMSPGRARACARDAIEFWIATGLFTLSGTDVRAQPRSLAEAALARQAIAESVSAKELMHYRRTSAGWDVLALLALERADVRTTWAEHVAADGSADELMALVDAHLDGARLDTEEIARLVDSAVVDTLRDDPEPDRIVEALLALDLPPLSVGTLRQRVGERLPLQEHPVIDAALLVRSPELTREELDRLRAFFTADRPESGHDEDGTLRIDTLDRLHLRALQDAAVRLIACSRQDAELVASRLEKLGTRRFPSRLRRAFRDAGHDDLAREARATPAVERTDWSGFGDFEQATRTALSVAAGLADGRPLSWTERRRLDELADLWTTMRSEWWRPRWVEARTEVLREWMHIAVVLGEFDAAGVAAQAQQLLNELEDDPDADDLLRDDGTIRPLTHWEHLDGCEATADALIHIFGRVTYQALRSLMQALATAPCQQHVHEATLAALPSLTRVWRAEGALVALATAEDPDDLAFRWSRHEDVRRREAAAAALPHLLQTNASRGEELAVTLLDDQDRGVQAKTVASVASAVEAGVTLSPAVIEALIRVENASRKPYVCRWCDAEVPARMTSCPECHSGGPSYQQDLERALSRPAPTISNDLSKRLRELAPRRRVRLGHDFGDW